MKSLTTLGMITAALLIYGSPEAMAHDSHQKPNHHRGGSHYDQRDWHRREHRQLKKEQARWEKWHRKQHARGNYHQHRSHPFYQGKQQPRVRYQGPHGLSHKYRTHIQQRPVKHHPHSARHHQHGHIKVDTHLRTELGRLGINLRF